MCGIAGVWGRDDVPLLRTMMDRLAHRGPDGQGIRRQPGRGVLGHRRLDLFNREHPIGVGLNELLLLCLEVFCLAIQRGNFLLYVRGTAVPVLRFSTQKRQDDLGVGEDMVDGVPHRTVQPFGGDLSVTRLRFGIHAITVTTTIDRRPFTGIAMHL